MGNIILLRPKISYEGYFRLQVINEYGKVVRDTGFFHNLITNSGLDFIGECSGVAYGAEDFTASCSVGTGNNPPSDTDTTLQAWLATASDNSGSGCNNNQSFVQGPPLYWQGQRSWQFPAGTATGNIAEIGVSPYYTTPGSAPGPTLFSRALVVDSGGNPTVIPVTATEALTVTYILRQYADSTDNNYTMSLSGTSYSGIYRLANAGTVPQLGISLLTNISNPLNHCHVYNGSIGTILQNPTGTDVFATLGDPPYTTGSYTKSLTASFTINQGNLSGGITAIMWQIEGGPLWQMSVSPAIPKTSAYNMTLSASFSWARYTP